MERKLVPFVKWNPGVIPDQNLVENVNWSQIKSILRNVDRRKAICCFLTRSLPKITTKMTSFIGMNEQAISSPLWTPATGVIQSKHFFEAMSILESHSNDSKNNHCFLANEKSSTSCSKRLCSKGFGEMRTMCRRRSSRLWPLTNL